MSIRMSDFQKEIMHVRDLVHIVIPEGYPSGKTLEVATKHRQHEECERAGMRMRDLEEEIQNVCGSADMVRPEGYPSGCLGRPMRKFERARREGYPSGGPRQSECISEKIKTLEVAMQCWHHEESERVSIRMSTLEKDIMKVRDLVHIVSPDGYPSGCPRSPMNSSEDSDKYRDYDMPKQNIRASPSNESPYAWMDSDGAGGYPPSPSHSSWRSGQSLDNGAGGYPPGPSNSSWRSGQSWDSWQCENIVFVAGFPRDYSTRASIEAALRTISHNSKDAVKAVWSPQKRWSNCRVQFHDKESMWGFLKDWRQQRNKQVTLDGTVCDIWCAKQKSHVERVRDGKTSRVRRILEACLCGLKAEDWETMFARRTIWAGGYKIAEFNKKTSEWELTHLDKFRVEDMRADILARIAEV
jgi:hypothetical protein